MCIETSCFPHDLKAAEITPIFKKEDRLDKANYRPVSVLPCLSKIFESVFVDQLSEFFEILFASEVSGFRKGRNCQHVLINFIEKCKTAMDNKKVYGALLTDLSKAFDCLPPKLLVAKLHAYGLDRKSCMMIANYFCNRKQRVKLSHIKSEWMYVIKGSPQGSLLGPLMYNIHSNDLFYCIMMLCDVFNYADDNTVGCDGDTILDVQYKLETVSSIMIDWFEANHLKANPSKFQYIVFNKSSNPNDVSVLNVKDNTIQAEQCVKLLGVTIDSKLNFSDHISELCVKAGRKMNVIARLSTILNSESKMLLFNSFILAHFNFCPVIWHFCKRSDKMKVEKIQYRALKYIDKDFTSSYQELRERYDKPLLHTSRLRYIVCEVFKCLHDINPAYLNDIFVVNNHNYDTRGVMTLRLPRYNSIKYGRDCFSYSGTLLWNSLDNDFRNVTCFKTFKRFLREWNGPVCKCSYCDICVLNNM